MESIRIGIRGMTCDGCVASVTRVLKGIDGVERADVTLEPPEAKVEYTPGRVDAARLRSAIEDAGYEVER
jgi:copper chaperone